jgi:putative flippase GtrA
MNFITDIIRRLLRIQFIRFLVVGGINTLFGYAVFALFIFLGLHYSLAILLATILGVLFNFQTYGRFVFYDKRFRLIVPFVLVYVVYYLVYVSGLAALKHVGLNDYVAGAVLAVPVAFVAFTLNKRFVFTRKV